MEARNQDITETEEAGKIERAAFSGVRSWYSWLRAAPWSSSTPTTAHTESEVLAGPGRCRRVGILVLACLHGRASHEHYMQVTGPGPCKQASAQRAPAWRCMEIYRDGVTHSTPVHTSYGADKK